MKSRRWFGLLVGVLTLVGLAMAWSVVLTRPAAGAQGASEPAPAAESGPTMPPSDPYRPRREFQGDAEAPAISFIDNPSPTCYRLAKGTGTCYIKWQYLRVTAASTQYIISMTVTIGDRLRAYHAGFFQTTMEIAGDVYGPGFRVACGPSGASGIVGLGNTYTYTIRARETGGLSAANYGSVTCPADVPNIALPLMLRR